MNQDGDWAIWEHNHFTAKVPAEQSTMPLSLMHRCECSNCLTGKEHRARPYHR